jgi:enoyl-CoA hydratase/carnithine racemase
MSSYETILTETSEAGVLRITLNRPEKKNAINDLMWAELADAFSGAGTDSAVRVVVITGAGDGFCSGADLSQPAGTPRPHISKKMRQVGDVAILLHALPKPTIAQVNGVAAGAGLNLALGCDLIVASDRARFSEIFARRGMSIDFGGSWLLPRLVGLHKAKQLVFFADVIDARKALEFGLVNEVVPGAELASVVDSWAQRLCAIPPLALKQSKMLLNRSLTSSLADALDAEGMSQGMLASTSDLKEAVAAFIERREGVYVGR